MRVADSFKNFDFDTIWTMEGDPNYAYPKLISTLKAGNTDPAPVQTTETNEPIVPDDATSAPQSSTETVSPGSTAKPGETHKSGISPLLIIVIILVVIAVVTVIILLIRKRSKTKY